MYKSHCYLSTSCFSNLPLREVLRQCDENGIFEVELSSPHPYEQINKIRELLSKYRKRGFDFTIHNYFPPQQRDFVLNIASLDDDIREKSKSLVEHALNLAKEIGSPVYGIHVGYMADGDVGSDGMFQFKSGKNDYLSSLQQMKRFIEDIVEKLNNNGVNLILENLFPGRSCNYSLGCTFDEIKEIMSLVPEVVGLLLDLGHLNVSSYILDFDKFSFLEQYFVEFGDRLYEVHFSENSGEADEHLPLGKESWQLKVLKDICAIPFSKNFSRIYCLEARNNFSFDSLKSSMDLINDCINS